MEHQQQINPQNTGGTPPPLGAIYESPPNTLERLRDLNEKDPAFVSWVLLRAGELSELVHDLGVNDAPEVKERITQNLIEAYDIHVALVARDQIMTMLIS